METGLIALAVALSIAIPALTTALAQGNATARAMEAIGRQPEAANEVRSTLLIALAFMEALTIYGLLIAFMLLGRV